MARPHQELINSVAEAGRKAGAASMRYDYSNAKHWRDHAEWDIDTLKAAGINGERIFTEAREQAAEAVRA